MNSIPQQSPTIPPETPASPEAVEFSATDQKIVARVMIFFAIGFLFGTGSLFTATYKPAPKNLAAVLFSLSALSFCGMIRECSRRVVPRRLIVEV